MADLDQRLEDLDRASQRFEVADAAREDAHKALVEAALSALRAGAEPGQVYERVPFTSTYVRTLARQAGIPAGRPGIKPAMKATPTGRPKKAQPKAMRRGQAAHGDGTSSPT